MKTVIKRCCAGIMAVLMMVGLCPVSALALTAQEQEDLYRVGVDWQNEESQQHIDWLLNSDNFIYHQDVTNEGFINAVKYASINLNPKTRKDNMVEILTSLIGFSSAAVREESLINTASYLAEELFGTFNKHLKTAISSSVGLEIDISEVIKKTSESYLNDYNISTDLKKYSYAEIKEQIIINVPTKYEDMVAEEFDLFINSSSWNDHLKDLSEVFGVLTKSIDFAVDGIGLVAELESYAVADEELEKLLTYIYKNTDDSALKEACIEVSTKLKNGYFDNLISEILSELTKLGTDLTLDKVKNALSSKWNLYLFSATVGIDAGKVVSDVWFNTNDQVELAQTMYCLNSITESLVKLLGEELDDFVNYKKNPFSGSEYASDVIYHLRVLAELRLRGETAYYNLKGSTYSATVFYYIGNLDRTI